MPKVLVLGDLITDKYRMCTATRLCPEGPVPVMVEQTAKLSGGGAGLVVRQLDELMGVENVFWMYGSESVKERIFADDRLMLRIDRDSTWVISGDEYKLGIFAHLGQNKFDAVIVSDYNKGAFTYDLGHWLVHKVNELGIPLFVDAKNTWSSYCGAFAMFPNKDEAKDTYEFVAKHSIQKLGAEGCRVDGVDFPQSRPHAVRDVTGAGDVFLAAFVAQYLNLPFWAGTAVPRYSEEGRLRNAALFANKVAGISVEHIGTHVVTKEEIKAVEHSVDKSVVIW
jgi:bifunctional ADP-heptose synthase (sugar kinase/adenylyltransferase)